MDFSEKRRRAPAVLLAARSLGDARFVEGENLLRIGGHGRARYNGLTVGQQSLEYAIALLETGEDRSDAEQAGDIARADAIIDRVLDFQVRDARHPRCGNFIWMTHWDEPLDPNAAAFITPPLTYLYETHGHHLQAATQARLAAALPLLGQCLLQREVPYEYTNIKLLTTAGQFLLARHLPDTALEQTARFHWLHTVAFIAHYGLAEYNSPTYLPVFLYALEEMWQRGPADLRPAFERMLEYCYFEFAARYHAPTGYLAGAMSRAYPQDVTTGQGLGALVAYLQWGLPLQAAPVTIAVANWVRSDYVAPPEVRRLALDKPMPVQMRAHTWNQLLLTRTDYFEPAFTLGSQNGYSGNQEIPLFATMRDGAPVGERRRSVYITPTAPGLARLVSQQEGAAVAGYYYYDLQAVRDGALLREPQSDKPLGLRWHLGDADLVRALYLNGALWDGATGALPRQGIVTARLGEVCLGLRYEVDAEIASETPLELGWLDGELTLSLHLGTAQSYVEGNQPLGMRFYLHLAEASAVSPQAMLVELQAADLAAGREFTAPVIKTVSVTNGKVGLAAAVPPPIYLHDSPLAQIKPNDLLPWFIGADDNGRHLLFGAV